MSYQIAQALAHFLWQGIAIALVLLGLLQVLRDARARYGACAAALALMCAAPVATFVYLSSAAAPSAGTRGVVLDTSIPAAAAAPMSWLQANSGLLFSLWMGGAVLLLLRASASWWRARRLVTRGVEPLEGPLAVAARSLAERMGATRVRFEVSARAASALVFGWLKPVVVLPAAALGRLSAAEVEALLAHELAHVVRYDFLVNLLQIAAECALFYHPLVWWVSARMRDERELCCDDIAVAVCHDEVLYSKALLLLEEIRMEPALAATGGRLAHRIQRLLDGPRTNRIATAPSLAFVLVFGISLALLAQDAPPAPPSPPAPPAAPAMTKDRTLPPAPPAPVAPAAAPSPVAALAPLPAPPAPPSTGVAPEPPEPIEPVGPGDPPIPPSTGVVEGITRGVDGGVSYPVAPVPPVRTFPAAALKAQLDRMGRNRAISAAQMAAFSEEIQRLSAQRAALAGASESDVQARKAAEDAMRAQLAAVNEKLANEQVARQAIEGFLKKNEAMAKEDQERMLLESQNARRELKLAAEQDAAARAELRRMEKELQRLREEVAVARHDQGIAAASEIRAKAESDELQMRRAFAAKHFGGENTDRAKAYIKYGPPDEIERLPLGKEAWRYKDSAKGRVKLNLAFQDGKLVSTQVPR